jgi:hypothetical protein
MAGGARFVLEGHHYAGGLHIKPFGVGKERPSWAPAPPDQYVGFRDEFTLVVGDAVVEFARFNYQGKRITWLAVYYRSVDEVFGDRGNHAGVGVWLNDALITNAGLLLEGLSQLSAELAKKGPDAIETEATVFSSQFVPHYLDLSARLPDKLSGWNFSPSNICQTAVFYADSPSSAENWASAAEQVYRASLLSAADPALCRALMLIPAQGSGSGDRNLSKMAPLIKASFVEVTKFLPRAIDELTLHNDSLRSMAEGLQEQLTAAQRDAEKLAAELENERYEKSTLAEQVTHLSDQLSGDGTARWLSSIDARLVALDSAVRGYSGDIGELSRAVRTATSVPRAAPPQPATRADPYDKPVAPQTRRYGFWDYATDWRVIFVILGIAFIMLLAFLFWRWMHSEDPTPVASAALLVAHRSMRLV